MPLDVPKASPPVSASGARPQPTLDPRLGRWMRAFDALGPALFQRVERPATPAHFLGAVKILGQVGAYLVREGRYPEAVPILRLLESRRRRGGLEMDAADAVGVALSLVLHPGWRPAMLAAYRDGDTITREALFELLSGHEAAAVPGIVRVLVEREGSAAVRRELEALVQSVGPQAGPALVAAIEAEGTRWQRVLPLVRLAGAIRFEPARPLVEALLDHPRVPVRAEALSSLYEMLGLGAEWWLVAGLEDAHPEVRQRAVALLAVAGSAHPRFMATLRDLLTREGGRGQEGLVVATVHALRDLGNVRMPGGGDAERLLVDMLRRGVGTMGSGLLRLVTGGRTPRSTALMGAVCDSLAAIGGQRARAALLQASRDGAPAVGERARAALAYLEARLSEAEAAGGGHGGSKSPSK